jgi:hypothetical protein
MQRPKGHESQASKAGKKKFSLPAEVPVLKGPHF